VLGLPGMIGAQIPGNGFLHAPGRITRTRCPHSTYVGLNLKPGPNRIRYTAINPREPLVIQKNHGDWSRSGTPPPDRFRKIRIQSGGSDSTIVRVKAFDQWGNPALDGQVGIETSLGQLMRATNDSEKPAHSLQHR